ncbi:MAG: hypothetical protein V1739_10330 [Candidatus Omnitrophota bacterium]
MEKIITFEKEAKRQLLNLFNKDVNEEGYIIEKDTREPILAPDGEFVEFNKFAGIKKGSLVFIKSDINSIIELADTIGQ